jgi:hypothetical protein
MQFFLTDLALGFGAILGYLTYELLARRRTPIASAATGNLLSRRARRYAQRAGTTRRTRCSASATSQQARNTRMMR